MDDLFVACLARIIHEQVCHSAIARCEVDEAVLGVYLAGPNTRRVQVELAPLLRGGPLSKDVVSRLVGRLRDDFDTWRSRDLAAEDIRYVFMDGWYQKVRSAAVRRGCRCW